MNRFSLRPAALITISLLAVGSLIPSAHAQTAADPNLYIGEYANEDIFKVNPNGGSLTGFIVPFGTGHRFSGFAWSPDNSYLLVTTGGGSSGQGNEVRKFDASGNFLGNFVSGLNLPQTVLFDPIGNAYISSGSSILKYSATGTLLQTINGSGVIAGLARDSLGNLYAASYSSGTVQKFDAGGISLGTIISGISNPEGLTIDSSNNLYVPSRGTSSVYKYTTSGSLLKAFTGFDNPINITADAANNIYVANYSSGATGSGFVSKISADGLSQTTVATGLTGTFGVAFKSAASAPEPASLALLGLRAAPLLACLARRRRKFERNKTECLS